MMDWTDRHYRYLARLLSKEAVLYTEMIHARAIVHGDRSRFLDFHPDESPVVLQLGGNEPEYLAEAARWGQRWGYSEINLNCGCPSDKVASGSFGACLMADPDHVARLVEAMKEAVSIPVTVKSRIGIEGGGRPASSDYEHLRRFTRTVMDGGCDRLIVHARIAVLGGLNPAENRSVPPLRYDDVYRLKEDFPELKIELNGGLKDLRAMEHHLQGDLDGIMVGRAAYETPAILWWVDPLMQTLPAQSAVPGECSILEPTPSQAGVLQNSGLNAPPGSRMLPDRTAMQSFLDSMRAYIIHQYEAGIPPHRVTRHMLGIMHGMPGARSFRQRLSGNWFRSMDSAKSLNAYLEEVFAAACEGLPAGPSLEPQGLRSAQSGSLTLQP